MALPEYFEYDGLDLEIEKITFLINKKKLEINSNDINSIRNARQEIIHFIKNNKSSMSYKFIDNLLKKQITLFLRDNDGSSISIKKTLNKFIYINPFKLKMGDAQDDSSFFLLNGLWYEIDSNYVDFIHKEYDKIPVYDKFPISKLEMTKSDGKKSEDNLNKKLAKITNSILLDRKFISPIGKNKLELCDFLYDSSYFIHCKVNNGKGPSMFSHLSQQIKNSWEYFIEEQELVIKKIEKVSKDQQIEFNKSKLISNAKLVALIYGKKGQDDLRPKIAFFSKVTFVELSKKFNSGKEKIFFVLTIKY